MISPARFGVWRVWTIGGWPAAVRSAARRRDPPASAPTQSLIRCSVTALPAASSRTSSAPSLTWSPTAAETSATVAVERRGQRVLHLHRFQRHQRRRPRRPRRRPRPAPRRSARASARGCAVVALLDDARQRRPCESRRKHRPRRPRTARPAPPCAADGRLRWPRVDRAASTVVVVAVAPGVSRSRRARRDGSPLARRGGPRRRRPSGAASACRPAPATASDGTVGLRPSARPAARR